MCCEMCLEKTGNRIKIYDPRDFVTFGEHVICNDCENDNLKRCRACGKQIYDTDLAYTDWHSKIPYDDDFESNDERYKIISSLESTFFCNQCRKRLFSNQNYIEICAAI